MAQREIYTVRELRKRLEAVGHPISEVQLGRVRKLLPKLLDTRLLAALCTVLDVPVGELLVRSGDPVYALAATRPVLPTTTKAPGASDADAPAKLVVPTNFPVSGPKVGAMRPREDDR
jgi:hypothetical protein